MNLTAIPGLGAALEQDRAERLAAWVADREVELCGITVRPLTLADTVYFEATGNGFFAGGTVEARHLLQFFDRLRTGKSLRWRQRKLDRIVGQLPYKGTCDAISEFIEWHYFDAPTGGKDKPTSSRAYNQLTIAFFVDLFASEYGWTDTHTLQMPLTKVWQLYQSIRMRQDKDYHGQSKNRQRVMQEFLRSLNPHLYND